MAKTVKELTADEQISADILEQLRALGGQRSTSEQFRYSDAGEVVIPARYEGDLLGFSKFIREAAEHEENPERFTKQFNYKLWDVAAAVVAVFNDLGYPVMQRNSFFVPAEHREIPIGVNKTMQVPVGKITVLMFSGTMRLVESESADGYAQCVMLIDSLNMHKGAVQGLWMAIDAHLAEHSIYRGKAITGSSMPEFLDVENFDESKVIYTRRTLGQIDANLWAPIEHPDICVRKGVNSKRKVLLGGPYGTGKTLGAKWTAKICLKQGRTFIMCNPKDNNVFECLHLAAHYAGANGSLLFVEDIDRLTEGQDRNQIAALLDALDGFQSKGVDVMMVFTTNRVQEIHQGVLRPGRLDAVIEIGEYDLDATTRMFQTEFSLRELDNVDIVAVFNEMKDFTPAFTKEVCERVKLRQIRKIANDEEVVYGTDDFMESVEEVRAQYDLHVGAKDYAVPSPIEAKIEQIVVGSMQRGHVVEPSGFDGRLMVDAKEGQVH